MTKRGLYAIIQTVSWTTARFQIGNERRWKFLLDKQPNVWYNPKRQRQGEQSNVNRKTGRRTWIKNHAERETCQAETCRTYHTDGGASNRATMPRSVWRTVNHYSSNVQLDNWVKQAYGGTTGRNLFTSPLQRANVYICTFGKLWQLLYDTAHRVNSGLV